MRILDLFAGAGGEERRDLIESRGHEYVTLDFDPSFNCNITADLFDIDPKDFIGKFDFVWASPPCECFSVASIGKNWNKEDKSPKTDKAKLAIKLLEKTVNFIQGVNPEYWIIENPRGMMRNMPALQNFKRDTVTYCQYGKNYMKPTDLWHNISLWTPREACKNGDPCHEAAPRGSRSGVQAIRDPAQKAIVPWALWEEILTSIEKNENG